MGLLNDVSQVQPAAYPGVRPTLPFRTWYWALVPLLTIVAYFTAVRVGFLKDDLQFLADARNYGFDLGRLVSQDAQLHYGLFYRPVGTVLTWRLGWQLWGANPFPYHLESVLIHAANALLVGLWLAQASGRRALGWLAGALFGVWPLHTEAVAWLSAQWDALAVLFGMLSLLLFTRWWRAPTPRRVVYLASLALYLLALYTKESMLPFIAMFAITAWYAGGGFSRRSFRRLGLALLPFFMALLGVLALRFAFWGQVGGYQWARSDFGEFLWDRLIEAVRLLVAPLNPAVVGAAAVQVTGVLTSLLLLAGLVFYGRQERRLLAMSGLWVLAALVPALNLRVSLVDMHNNRFLYLASIGFCMGVAALIYSAATSLTTLPMRRAAMAAIGVLILACIALTWAHLRPWHTLTVMVDELDRTMLSLVPPRRGGGAVWYVENRPFFYKGAPGVGLFFGYTRGESGGDVPDVVAVEDAPGAIKEVAAQQHDAFAMRFAPVTDPHFRLDYLTGITNETAPPTLSGPDNNLLVWDFTDCGQGALSRWKAANAEATCVPGDGLRLLPQSGNPQLLGPEVAIQPEAAAGPAIRLRAGVRYIGGAGGPAVQRWYWADGVEGGGFGSAQSRSMYAREDGGFHVYWTFLQASEVRGELRRLRFDPGQAVEVKWLAADAVP